MSDNKKKAADNKLQVNKQQPEINSEQKQPAKQPAEKQQAKQPAEKKTTEKKLTVEQRIQKMLLENLEPMRVADELLKSWARNELSLRDQIHVGYFLFQAGYYPTILNQVKKNITAGWPVPWPALMQVLGLNAGLLDKELIDKILIGATEENFLDEVIFCPSLDIADSRFAKIRQRFYENNKIFFKQQPAKQQEPSQVLTPQKTPQPQPQKLNLDEEEMRALLKKKEFEFFIEDKVDFNDEYQLGAALVEKAKKDPSIAYLISVSLYLMNCVAYALQALAYAPSDESSDWFSIQLLLENKLFIEALNKINLVEKKYEENPDTASSALLLKAKALWGLNDRNNAIQILEIILKEIPQHYQARTLIREWRHEL